MNALSKKGSLTSSPLEAVVLSTLSTSNSYNYSTNL